jgi:hypothetical protein
LGNSVWVSDPDSATNPVEVQLSLSIGTITLNETTGLSFSLGDGSNDAVMKFLGSTDDINRALDALRISFAPEFAGAASLSITANDQGNTGTGGPQSDTESVSIWVVETPTPDDPVVDPAVPPPSPNTDDPPADDPVTSTPAEKPTVPEETPSPTPTVETPDETGGPPRGAGSTPPRPTPDEPPDSSPPDFDYQSPLQPPQFRPLHAAPIGQVTAPSATELGTLVTEVRSLDTSRAIEPLILEPTLWRALDTFEKQVSDDADEQRRHDELVIGTLEVTTMLFSVGVVTWLLRAASLATALLSSMPLWARFDPLPVLELSETERRKKLADLQGQELEDQRQLGRILDPPPRNQVDRR